MGTEMIKKWVVVGLVLASFTLGVLTATLHRHYTQQKAVVHEQEEQVCGIDEEDSKCIELMIKYNPKLSEDEAHSMYKYIHKTILRYHSDSYYSTGATSEVNSKLFLALVLVESGARNEAVSSSGAIGLTQVMPLHVRTLYSAGVISEPSTEELKRREANIRAGVHILMTYAKGVDTLHRALARYNAGASNERHGHSYASKVIRIYQQLGGEV
jgi:soluble lytic murein transglycosylase-like protein